VNMEHSDYIHSHIKIIYIGTYLIHTYIIPSDPKVFLSSEP
jgi:hypothetical protein